MRFLGIKRGGEDLTLKLEIPPSESHQPREGTFMNTPTKRVNQKTQAKPPTSPREKNSYDKWLKMPKKNPPRTRTHTHGKITETPVPDARERPKMNHYSGQHLHFFARSGLFIFPTGETGHKKKRRRNFIPVFYTRKRKENDPHQTFCPVSRDTPIHMYRSVFFLSFQRPNIPHL